MNTNELLSFQEKIEECKTLEEAESICLEFSREFRWEYYLFGVVAATSLSAPKITTITNYPDEWWLYYFKEEMQKSDPVVKYCFERFAPIRWDKLMKMEQYNSPAAEKLMARARELGLVNGMSIPIKSPSGDVAIFSLATSNNDDIENRFMESLFPAQAFSNFLFEAYTRFQANTNETIKLTPRENECLFWACEGKTAWEISKILDVSERTVIFHMTGAAKKLGASNRQHAVAKAILHGLIKPVP